MAAGISGVSGRQTTNSILADPSNGDRSRGAGGEFKGLGRRVSMRPSDANGVMDAVDRSAKNPSKVRYRNQNCCIGHCSNHLASFSTNIYTTFSLFLTVHILTLINSTCKSRLSSSHNAPSCFSIFSSRGTPPWGTGEARTPPPGPSLAGPRLCLPPDNNSYCQVLLPRRRRKASLRAYLDRPLSMDNLIVPDPGMYNLLFLVLWIVFMEKTLTLWSQSKSHLESWSSTYI